MRRSARRGLPPALFKSIPPWTRSVTRRVGQCYRCYTRADQFLQRDHYMADGGKRNIPIKLGDFSVIDTEFSNIRERFDAEMRKMEEEMTRFRSELMNRESNFFKTTSSTTSNTVSTGSDAPKGGSSTWLDSLNSPLIQDSGDNKMLKLRFDVSQYQPEEIVVKTVDNKLLVHAKHEEKTESKSVYREYNREFLLPKGTNPESIKSSLSKDGVLTVEAPLPALGQPEKLIPIAQN